jgi:hypothetical protein
VEAESGLRWAELLASLRASGRAMPIKDSLIASTALLHGLNVVTRNRADFEKAGVKVVNPFGLQPADAVPVYFSFSPADLKGRKLPRTF